MSDIQYASADAVISAPIVRCEGDGNIELSLPASPYPGQSITIVIGAATVTLDGNGNTVNDDNAPALGAVATCVYAGGNWVVTGLDADGTVSA